jgi:hypothetical protein
MVVNKLPGDALQPLVFIFGGLYDEESYDIY